MSKTGLALVAVVALTACGKDVANQQASLEAEFEKTMTGAVLAGKFTSLKNDNVSSDRYTIEKVSKLGGDLWLIQARIQYGEHDVTAPIPVKVVWAADTPIISLTDAGIPGLGTFTARILIFRRQYAGTWSSSSGHGGQMYGKIERR